MENYIINNHSGATLVLSKKAIESLSSYRPKGCPFADYTFLDMLKDFVNMYSWKITGKITVTDFIQQLQNESYDKAIAYGDDIITYSNDIIDLTIMSENSKEEY